MRDEVSRLAAISGRGACTDAERRAAVDLRDALRARGRAARLEPAWVRPQWPAAYTLLCLLGVGGSVLAAKVPVAGIALLGATLASFLLELTLDLSPARLLFRRRATQNVVSEPALSAGDDRVRLIVTASVDAPRTGSIFGEGFARLEGRARTALGGHLSSPAAMLAGLLVVLIALAGVRVAGGGGVALGAVQLAPTVVLLLACGVLVDVALSPPSPGANADASAVAVALALARELDAAPLRRLAVEVVLAGAGDGRHLGMRAYVRARRQTLPPERVVVLALGPCGAGRPRFHVTEGLVAPLRLHPRLVELAGQAAADERHLGAAAARRGFTGAYPARQVRWPAISIGCRDAGGSIPRARRPEDTADHVDPAAMRAALELCQALVARLDADLARTPAPPAPRSLTRA